QRGRDVLRLAQLFRALARIPIGDALAKLRWGDRDADESATPLTLPILRAFRALREVGLGTAARRCPGGGLELCMPTVDFVRHVRAGRVLRIGVTPAPVLWTEGL